MESTIDILEGMIYNFYQTSMNNLSNTFENLTKPPFTYHPISNILQFHNNATGKQQVLTQFRENLKRLKLSI